MWLQLFVLGLPIIPASVDRYLQAKLKQYIINPIVNFLYGYKVCFSNRIHGCKYGTWESLTHDTVHDYQMSIEI